MTLAVRLWMSLLLTALGAYTVWSGYRLWVYQHQQADVANVLTTVDQVDATVAPGSAKSIRDVADITLTERSGASVPMKSLENQVWIGSFFFASCPGTCRQINTAMAGLQQDLKGKNVKLVSITVDPDNDTPQVLRDYAQSFGADPKRWLFLTGNFEDIRRVCADVFAMPIDRKVHTERFILVDRQGRRRGIFNYSEPAQMAALAKGIDLLLAEPAEPSAAVKQASKERG